MLVGPLTDIINASLQTGVFPTALKKGVVHPSLKKSKHDYEQYSSYRPITNIAFLSKTIERVAATQTMNYFADNDLLPKFQSAYRPHHSTETALACVFNDILKAIDQHQEVVLVLFDLSSAFDTIDHGDLLARLRDRYGFTGKVLSWFESYLTSRVQSVIINDTQSSELPVSFGVPQGSVLGPLLFSLFFAPLEEIIAAHGLNCMIYSDDTQLYVSLNPKSREHVLSSIDLCTKDIMAWCTSNGLSCNAGKTEAVHISSCYSISEKIDEIRRGDAIIIPTLTVRDLGTIVDHHLDLGKHVNNICKSASFAIKNISRIRKYLSQSDCERIIHAFITSSSVTAMQSFTDSRKHSWTNYNVLKKTAARIVSKTKKSQHITPVLRSLHWPPIHKRIVFKLLLLTYKGLNGQAPSYISELLTKYKPSRNLRSGAKYLLTVPRSNTKTYGDRSFQVAAAELFQ